MDRLDRVLEWFVYIGVALLVVYIGIHLVVWQLS